MSIQKIKTNPERAGLPKQCNSCGGGGCGTPCEYGYTEPETTYIIRTGTKHYSLYLVVNIATCKHVANLDKDNYENRMQAKAEFKTMLTALHSNNNFSLEFKE